MHLKGVFVVLFLLLFILDSVMITTHALLLSKSSVETCDITSTTNSNTNTSSSCREKLFLTFSIEADEAGTESVVLTESSGTNGTTLYFTEPLEIKFYRRPTYVLHPLYYTRHINVFPKEVIFYTNQFECDDVLDESCGGEGRGFCCSCPSCAKIGLCDATLRGVMECGFGSFEAVAACMATPADEWRRVFTIGSPFVLSEISVAFLRGSTTAAVTVGSTSSIASQDDVTVKYSGELSNGVEIPSLTNYYFLEDAARAAPYGGYLLQQSDVDLHGLKCGALGVSPETYVAQSERCGSPSGSCLVGAQLDTRVASQAAIRAAGAHTTMFLNDHGEPVGFIDSALAYNWSHGRAAVVTVIADVADVILRRYIAKFRFVSWVVEATDDTLAISIFVENEAMVSGAGELTVVCADTSSVFPSKRVVLASYETRNVTLVAHASKTRTDTPSCLVRALNGVTGDVMATANVSWTPPADIIIGGENADDGLVNPDGSITVVRGTGGGDDCTDCPWYNPLCFMFRRCFWQGIIKTVLVVILVGVALVVVKYVIQYIIKRRKQREDRRMRAWREQRRRGRSQPQARARASRRPHSRGHHNGHHAYDYDDDNDAQQTIDSSSSESGPDSRV
eukprot:PhM_4_TR5221/c0_g1_i1/m.54864